MLTEINDKAAENAEQDQTARLCSLILPHTVHNRVPNSQPPGHESNTHITEPPGQGDKGRLSFFYMCEIKVNSHSSEHAR